MKKFEYRLELYQFKANNDLASNIEKAFRKEGLNGWELVQWEVMQTLLEYHTCPNSRQTPCLYSPLGRGRWHHENPSR